MQGHAWIMNIKWLFKCSDSVGMNLHLYVYLVLAHFELPKHVAICVMLL